MCGIAGYSFKTTPPPWLAHSLFVGIAERGSDSVGIAWPNGEQAVVQKWKGLVWQMLERLELDAHHQECILHVREYTKGSPANEDNNHPIRHGKIVGVHNGVIENDEELFAKYQVNRERAGMTVDSEAIFMLVDKQVTQPWKELFGTYTTAWCEDQSKEINILRGGGRPLHIVTVRDGVIWASTQDALEYALEMVPMQDVGDIRSVQPGTALEILAGEIVSETTFLPHIPEEYVLPLYDDQLHLQEKAKKILGQLIAKNMPKLHAPSKQS